MAVTTEAVSAPVKVAKKKTVSKPKKVADHPTYAAMIKDALTSLKERGGSSRVAILKYITKKYNLGQDEKMINAHLKMALRSGIKSGSLKHSKGTGATGSFRVGVEKQTKAGKKPKAAGAKKPKVAKKPKAKKPKAAAGAAKVKKAKVAKKPKSPTKAVKPAAAKKPKAAKAAKPKAPTKVQKPKAVKAKKVAAKK